MVSHDLIERFCTTDAAEIEFTDRPRNRQGSRVDGALGTKFANGPMEPPFSRHQKNSRQYVKQAPPGVQILAGPNGGRYYLSPSGDRVYVDSGNRAPVASFAPKVPVKHPKNPGNYPVAKPAQAIPVRAPLAQFAPRAPMATFAPQAPLAKLITPPRQPTTLELGPLARTGGEEGASSSRITAPKPGTDVLRGSFQGDAERATAEQKRESMNRVITKQVTEAESLLTQTEAYVKTAPITPTQKARLLRTRKHVLKDAQEMRNLAEKWEANPHERITAGEAKQQLAEADRALAEVQTKFTEAYREISAAKAKKARGKELRAMKKEANSASEAREHARRVLQLAEAYAGKVVPTHDPNFRTRVR